MENTNKNIEQDAPILFGLKRDNTLKVPDAYFDKLPEELLQIANNKAPKVINLKQWFVYTSAIAALIIFGFFSLQQYNQQIELEDFNHSFSELTAMNFEEELFEEGNLLPIDFNDDKELSSIFYELD